MMTVKEYLNQYQTISRDITSKKNKLRKLHENLTDTAAKYGEKIGSNPNKNIFQREEQLCEASDLQRELEERIVALTEMQQAIVDMVNRVEEPSLREILCLRYIQCLEWSDIARQIFLTVDGCYRRHRRAVRCLEQYAPFEKWNIS